MRKRAFIPAGFLTLMLLPASTGSAATFTVTNTNDAGPGSLRQAILDANTSSGADTISFSIPGTGVQTIVVASPLPPLTDEDGLTIDGYSQPGASPNTLPVGNDAVLKIELTGTTGERGFGLTLRSSANVIRGLVINGFGSPDEFGGGILVEDGSDNVVSGCFIGTDAAGSATKANRFGVSVAQRSDLEPGIPSGTRIGGTSPADRNVISGNLSVGVAVATAGSGTTLLGNYVGTTAGGNAALGNATGISVSLTTAVIVGGTSPGSGNVVSGNFAGIIVGLGSTKFLLQGNRIGTDATGSLALPNSGSGVQLVVSDEAVIGGSAPGAGNVISANSFHGVRLFNCSGVLVAGNLIGTAADGTSPLGNGQDGVVMVGARSTDNMVGGSGSASGNTIAFNGAAGVAIGGNAEDLPQGNRVLGNSIHDNGGPGIDLGSDGVTANDAGDTGVGPNNLQNFPVLTGALVSAVNGKIVLQATQDSNPASGANELQFFLADADTSGHGEGGALLFDQPGLPAGFVALKTPGFVPASPVQAGDQLTATATTQNGTSEFSQSLSFVANRLPTASAGPNQTVSLGSKATLNGSGSADPDAVPNGPSILNGLFTWKQMSGPPVTLASSSSAAPFFVPTVPGTYLFSLVVSDGLDVSTNPASVTVLVPEAALIWVGLKNSDDVGMRFDLKAEILRNGSSIAAGEVDNVPGGSSGFGGAIRDVLSLTLSAPIHVGPGDTLSIRLWVRAGASGHRSGTARLWFGDAAAASQFDVGINGVLTNLYLLDGFHLGTSPGPGPKSTIDVFVDRAAGGNPFKPFGTWSKSF